MKTVEHTKDANGIYQCWRDELLDLCFIYFEKNEAIPDQIVLSPTDFWDAWKQMSGHCEGEYKFGFLTPIKEVVVISDEPRFYQDNKIQRHCRSRDLS